MPIIRSRPARALKIMLSLGLITAANADTAGGDPAIAAKCRQWGLEDGVPAPKLPDYIRSCAVDQEKIAKLPPDFPVITSEQISRDSNNPPSDPPREGE